MGALLAGDAITVVGVDPGYAFMGLGVMRLTPSSMRLLHHETVRTSAKADPDERFDAITDRLCDVVEEYEPVAMGFEDQSGVEAAIQRDAEGGTNHSSRRVHEVVGSIRAVARFYRLRLYKNAISTVKVAVLGKGGGRASKDQMKLAVRRIFGLTEVVSEHAADAVAVAVATVRKERAYQLSMRRAVSVIH